MYDVFLFSQQDAHEFLADLSDLLDCEVTARYQALYQHICAMQRQQEQEVRQLSTCASSASTCDSDKTRMADSVTVYDILDEDSTQKSLAIADMIGANDWAGQNHQNPHAVAPAVDLTSASSPPPFQPSTSTTSVLPSAYHPASVSKSALKRRHDELIMQGDVTQLTAKKRRASDTEDDFMSPDASSVPFADVVTDAPPDAAVMEHQGRLTALVASTQVSAPTISLPMAGLLQSTVCMSIQCLQCGHSHQPKQEVYQHLPLNFPDPLPSDTHAKGTRNRDAAPSSGASSQSPLQLCSLVSEFFREETRELQCESCGGISGDLRCADPSTAGRVRIRSRWSEPPEVLVLQLKRFHYDYSTNTFTKVTADVSFPARLDLTEYVQTGDTQLSVVSTGLSARMSRTEESVTVSCFDDPRWGALVQDIEADPTLLFHVSKYAILVHSTVGTARYSLCHICCSISQVGFPSTDTATVLSTAKPAKYQLSAVVRHIGSTEGAGHYTCDALHCETAPSSGQKREWRRYDDSVVTVVPQVAIFVHSYCDVFTLVAA